MAKKFSSEDYVHEYQDKQGRTRYAVAEWDESHGQWVAPLDAETRKLTGCFAEFARTLSGIGGFIDKREAQRRARKLFGGRNA